MCHKLPWGPILEKLGLLAEARGPQELPGALIMERKDRSDSDVAMVDGQRLEQTIATFPARF